MHPEERNEGSGLAGARRPAASRPEQEPKSSEERLQMADTAIAAMPEMPEFLGDKGMILAEMKRYEEAKQALLQALALPRLSFCTLRVAKCLPRGVTAINLPN